MEKKVDRPLVLAILGILAFSSFTIFGIRSDLILNQLGFVFVGLLIFVVIRKIGIDFFRHNAIVIYSILMVVLLAILIFADPVRGSRRWFDLYFFRFQPSELLKPFFIILLADLLSSKKSLKSKLIYSFFIFVVPTFLILQQPDLGNGIIFVLMFASLLFFSGIPMLLIGAATFFTILVSPIIWHLLHQYQKERLISFLAPEKYSQDIGYNLIQSIITVGSGALIGRGLGYGTQTKFLFLPENHTDFAFASLVEQFGFMGGLAVLFLYAVIIYRLLLKVRSVKSDKFSYLFLVGTIVLLLGSVFINVGMNLGLMPVTGITLPLLSYGGSSVLSTLLLLALASSI